MVETAKTIWADGPSSQPQNPDKSKIRAWGTWLESFVTAIGTNSGSIYATRAALFADLAHPANAMAWVVDDPTVGNNGIYQKSGISGAGAWSRIADLPYSFITATDVGAGTPNAIQATTEVPVSASSLVIVNVFEANTGSPVTVSFNGGPALTIKTNSGNNVVAGGLVAGMRLLGVVSDATFRLVSDQVSNAIVAAAEGFAVSASGSATAAGISAGNASNSEELAQRWATNDEDVPVLPGLFSAYHWARKAAAVVTGGIADAIQAATAKPAMADADKFGFWDSVSGQLRSLTLPNLISSIFKTSRTIDNAQFAAATFKLINAASTRELTFDVSALTGDRKIIMANADLDANKVGVKGGASIVLSGTANLITGIPAGAKRVTLLLNAVVLSASGQLIMQLGTSGGLVASGYDASAGVMVGTSVSGINSAVSSFAISTGSQAGPANGSVILTRLGSTNTWLMSGIIKTNSSTTTYVSGRVDLTDALERINLTTAAGTPTFSGAASLSWEF